MRKFLLCLMAMTFMLVIPACNGPSPKLNYDVQVEGTVFDQASSTDASFDAHVTNAPVNVLQAYESCEVLTLEDPRAANVIDWADQFVAQITKEIPKGASYRITIKGYVVEINTGLKFSIDKTFTNQQLVLY